MGAGTCIGICKQYGRMSNKKMKNKKYCTECMKFLSWEGLRCPCCSTRLREKKHASIYAKKISDEKSERLGY